MIRIKAIIIFEISLGIRNFKFEVKKSGLNYKKSFIIRFRLANLNKACEIY